MTAMEQPVDQPVVQALGVASPPVREQVLEVTDLKVYFPITDGIVIERHVGDVKAVDDVSLTLRAGETLGLVGESGCGKSTIGRAILRLYNPTAGKIVFDGQDITTPRRGGPAGDAPPDADDLPGPVRQPEPADDRRRDRRRAPRHPPHRDERPSAASGSASCSRSSASTPTFAERYPHEFSGGQRQRIGVARALAVNPDLIVADEPISALDVSIQAQIINLLERLQGQFDLTYLFIAHDLSVVRHISDRIAVMYLGRIVELASSKELYTRAAPPVLGRPPVGGPDPGPGRRVEAPPDHPARRRAVAGRAAGRAAGSTPAAGSGNGWATRRGAPRRIPSCASWRPATTVACHFAEEVADSAEQRRGRPAARRRRRRARSAARSRLGRAAAPDRPGPDRPAPRCPRRQPRAPPRADRRGPRRGGAGLVVFPELGLTGYLLQDLAAEVAMRLDDPRLLELAAATRGLSAVVSFVEESADHRLFIAAALLEDGRVRHVHRKLFLPTYGLFDERRFFAAGDLLRATPSRLGDRRRARACARTSGTWPCPQLLALDGAQILVNVVVLAGPRPGGAATRSASGRRRRGGRCMRTYAQLTTSFVVFVQPGRGRRVDHVLGRLRGRSGRPATRSSARRSTTRACIFVDVDLADVRRERIALPLLRDERLELAARELDRIVAERAGHGAQDSTAEPGAEPGPRRRARPGRSRSWRRGRRDDAGRRPRARSPDGAGLFELPPELAIDTDVARRVIAEFIRGQLRQAGFERAVVGPVRRDRLGPRRLPRGRGASAPTGCCA